MKNGRLKSVHYFDVGKTIKGADLVNFPCFVFTLEIKTGNLNRFAAYAVCTLLGVGCAMRCFC